MSVEERIFELFGRPDITLPQVAATAAQEFGISQDEAADKAMEVLRTRGTPGLVRIREALDRVEAIIPYI